MEIFFPQQQPQRKKKNFVRRKFIIRGCEPRSSTDLFCQKKLLPKVEKIEAQAKVWTQDTLASLNFDLRSAEIFIVSAYPVRDLQSISGFWAFMAPYLHPLLEH